MEPLYVDPGFLHQNGQFICAVDALRLSIHHGTRDGKISTLHSSYPPLSAKIYNYIGMYTRLFPKNPQKICFNYARLQADSLH